MTPSQIVQSGYGQLELLFALVVVCAFLAVVLPLLVERFARRGY